MKFGDSSSPGTCVGRAEVCVCVRLFDSSSGLNAAFPGENKNVTLGSVLHKAPLPSPILGGGGLTPEAKNLGSFVPYLPP